MRIPLSIGITDNPRTWPIIERRVKPDGIDLVPTVLHPSELFWRQLRFAEFDVSEMSMSSLMIAKSKGDDRFVGIPVFTTRLFFHTTILVAERRQDRQARRPQGQAGRRAGVSADRGAVGARRAGERVRRRRRSDMEFWMERNPSKSHGGATGFKPPPGVTVNQIPEDKSIGSMMVSGELDAVMFYLVDPNLIDRSTVDLHSHPDIKPLFPDPLAEGVRYYKKTGLLSDQPRHGDQARDRRAASLGDHQHPQGVQAGQRASPTASASRTPNIISRPACCRPTARKAVRTPLDHPRRRGEPHGAGDHREIFAAAGADQPADEAGGAVRAEHAAAVVTLSTVIPGRHAGRASSTRYGSPESDTPGGGYGFRVRSLALAPRNDDECGYASRLSPLLALKSLANVQFVAGLSPPACAASYCVAGRSTRGRSRDVVERDRRAVAWECEMRGAERTPRPGGPSREVP